jgi:Gluconate 2-dehydrogenase subunit 3
MLPRGIPQVDRREFLAALAGMSALMPSLALAQELHRRARATDSLQALSVPQDAMVQAVAGWLLPETETVGALAVGVNRFIDLLFAQSLPQAQRQGFLAGLAAIDARSQAHYGVPLASLKQPQQQALLAELDAHVGPGAVDVARANSPVTAEEGFALLKRLIVFAYFTSEPVAKGLIGAPIIPGRYDGCVPV